MSEALVYWFKVALVILPWAAMGALLKIDHHFGNAILWMIPALGSVRILVGHIPEVQRELDRKPTNEEIRETYERVSGRT